MYKLIDSSSFFRDEDLQVTILNAPGATDTLVKAAADERITSYVLDSLRPEPGKIYLHINAMGAGEYYGSNRNGDYFPEEVLKQYYKTFETSPAHVFRHHINKDPAKAIGKVLLAIYNERMHRVELIAEVDKSLGQDIESRIAHGDFPATSMACKTPYDVCSICGNKAHTRNEYCVHLKQHLGRVMPDGKRVMSMNVAPLRFFDISIVIKPADITSSVLQKVAHSEPMVSSAQLAEEEGLGLDAGREKSASLAKVSELVKKIEGYVQDADPSLSKILDQIEDPDISEVKKLDSVPVEEILRAFGELGISPSLKFLADLLSHRLGNNTPGIGLAVVKALHDYHLGESDIPDAEMDVSTPANPLVKKAFFGFQDSCSLFPEFIEKRAYRGYAGQGPKIAPEPEELERLARIAESTASETKSLPFDFNSIHSLLAIGGAALWAKAYINEVIADRMLQMRVKNRDAIVKMASESAGKELASPAVVSIATKLVTSTPIAKNHPVAVMALKTAKAVNSKINKADPS